MNILFLTMVSGLKNIETSGIYTDLMRKFRDKGNEVYIIYPFSIRFVLVRFKVLTPNKCTLPL